MRRAINQYRVWRQRTFKFICYGLAALLSTAFILQPFAIVTAHEILHKPSLIAQLHKASSNKNKIPTKEHSDPRVSIAKIVVNVKGKNSDSRLRNEVYRVIQTKPGTTTTRSQLQKDINAIFETGFFSNVKATPEDTPIGVSVIFEVQPNPVLQSVRLEKSRVLPAQVVKDIFGSQYGKILNWKSLQLGIVKLNKWYQDNGYVLAQVADTPDVSPDGSVTLSVVEGVIDDIQVQFADKSGNKLDKQGKPIKGVTPIAEILSVVKSKPGTIFNQSQLEEDIANVYGLGTANDVSPSIEQSKRDSHKVTLVIVIKDEVINEWNEWTKATAAATLSAQTRTDYAIQQYQKVLQIARTKGSKAKEALTLNNLANIYQKANDNQAAFRAYSEAQAIFQELNAPLLEILMLIKMAEVSRTQEEPEQAITFYQKALTKIRAIKTKPKLEDFFGNALVELKNQVSTSEGSTQAFLVSFLSMSEFAIMLELAAHYSALGDYQQAIYLTHSARLIRTSNDLSEVWESAARSRLGKISSNLPHGDQVDDGLQPIFLKLAPKLARLIARLPTIYQPLMLRFTYSELGNPKKQGIYDDQARQAIKETLADVNKIISELDTSLDNITTKSSLRPYTDVIIDAITVFSNDRRTDRDIQRLNQRIVNASALLLKDDDETSKWVLPFVPIALSFFSNSLNTDEQQLMLSNSLLASLDSLQASSIEAVSTASDPENALNGMPDQKQIASLFRLVKATSLQMRGEAYFKLDKPQFAIDSYQQAIQLTSLDDKKNKPKDLEQLFQSLLASNPDLVKSLQSILESMQITIQTPSSNKEKLFKSNLEKLMQLITSNPELIKQFIQNADSIYSLRVRASVYKSLGEVYRKIDKFEEARNFYYQALTLESFFGKSNATAEIHYELAQVEHKLGKLFEAQSQIEKAIDILGSIVPKKVSQFGKSGYVTSEYIHAYDLKGRGKIGVSVGFSGLGIWDNSSSNLVNSSFMAYCATPSAYFDCRQRYFDLYIELLMQLHQEHPAKRYDVLAFEASERARTNTNEVFQGARLEDIKKSIQNRQPNATDRLLLDGLRFDQPVNLAEIQPLLDDNTLLLEYFLGKRRSYLWVISKTSIKVISLPSRAEIEKKARLFYEYLTSPNGQNSPQTTAEIGRQLSQVILGDDLFSQLNQKRLLVVGDGILQFIPFGALPSLRPDRRMTPARLKGQFAPYMQPLFLTNEIINLPSASILAKIRQRHNNRPTPAKELAIFADPVFNHRDRRAERMFIPLQMVGSSAPAFHNTNISPAVEAIYSPLSGTQQELEQITKLLPSSKRTTWLGFDATYQNALSSNLDQYRIIHFATHGIFNTRALDRSGIILSSFNQEGDLQRGLLSSRDAFKMKLSAAELLVLSGCSTGLGNEVRREALTGLTGSLLTAGAERIMVSLWSVNDEATAKLMEVFYRKMLNSRNPLSPSQALREAQRFMWNESKFQAPYNWAAFIIQGEWRDLQR